MRLSMMELVFMNSVTKGPEPLNIQLKLPLLSIKARVIEDTVKNLQDSNILDSDRNLTKSGIIPMRLFELYKNAGEHFSVNQLRIARTCDDKWIVLVPVGDAFEILALEPVLGMSLLVSTFPFLRQGQDRHTDACLPHQLTDNQTVELKESVKQVLTIKKFVNRNLTSECLYYFTGEQCFLIDSKHQLYTQLYPRDARVQIMEILDIKGDIENGC